MIEKFNTFIRRAYWVAPFVFALSCNPPCAMASEANSSSTDNMITENGGPGAVPDNAAVDTQITYSPVPLRPALRGDLVAAPPADLTLASASEQECLAEAMYYEARGEGLLGEEAIAEVVFHRMQSGKYPHTICGVVYQGASFRHGCQFSFTCSGELLRPRIASAWNRANTLAVKILTGLVQLGDLTGNAISFHAADVQPGWGDHLVRTIRIGRHVFYRSASRLTRAS